MKMFYRNDTNKLFKGRNNTYDLEKLGLLERNAIIHDGVVEKWSWLL